MTQPLNRQIEVSVGPLEEWRGGGDESVAVTMFANGTPDGFRIKFTAPKHIISTASPTVISIYNLSVGVRNTLRKSGARVVLRAGWDNVGLVEVFRGSLQASVSRREGPDVVTDLLCLAGFGSLARSFLFSTFAGGSKLDNIILTAAKTIPGITVEAKTIQVKNVTIGNQGSSHGGLTSEYLDKLARVHGFSWWISNSIFYALDDDQSFLSGKVKISANSGYLLRAEPLLATPMQVRTGTSIHSLFNPYIQPGATIELETAINPQINGDYKVHSLTHSGDSHSNDWTSRIESWVTVI